MNQSINQSSEKIKFAIKLTVVGVTDYIARELDIDSEEALRQFAKSKTYALLQNGDSMLYTESTEYVLDMLRSENNGDWEEWQRI